MARRLRQLAAALLLAATTARADVAVVTPVDAGGDAARTLGIRESRDMVTRLLAGAGSPYLAVSASQTNVDSLARGAIHQGGLDWSRYGVVVITGFEAGANAAPWKADDLTLLAGKPPRIPVVLVGNTRKADVFKQATTCSTGVSAAVTYSATRSMAYVQSAVGLPYIWKADGVRMWTPTSTRAAPGWRALVQYAATSATAGTFPANPDNPTRSDNPDTVTVWMRDLSSLKDSDGIALGQLIFVDPGGQTTTSQFQKVDLRAVLYALAMADSLSHGAVYGHATAIPRQFSIDCDDGYKWSSDPASSAMQPQDVATQEASADSMVAAGVKLHLGVESDSLVQNAAQDAVWSRYGTHIRYTPHVHAGTEDAPLLETSMAHPNDAFGTGRARSSHLGVTDCATDTCAICLHRAQFAFLRAKFGDGKISRIGLAPQNNWKGTRVVKSGGTLGSDSLISTLIAGGYRGMRTDAAALTQNMSVNSSTASGVYSDFITLHANLGSTNGNTFTILPDGGGPSTCSDGNSWVYGDEMTSSAGTPPAAGVGVFVDRLLWGLFGSGYVAGTDFTSNAGNFSGAVRVLTLHVCELGSDTADGTVRRPGFYSVKYLLNAVAAINAKATRRVLENAWPDDIVR